MTMNYKRTKPFKHDLTKAKNKDTNPKKYLKMFCNEIEMKLKLNHPKMHQN